MYKCTYAAALAAVITLAACSGEPTHPDPVRPAPSSLLLDAAGGGGLGSGSRVSPDSATTAESLLGSDEGEEAERGGGGLGSGS